MKKIIPFVLLCLLFIAYTSCSKSPLEKAKHLIEAGSGAYKEKPKFTFDNQLEEVIDKDVNDVIGYTLDYTLEVGDTKLSMRAKFNKSITTITEDNAISIIEEEDDDE
jgi:uncharacterized protein YpmS